MAYVDKDKLPLIFAKAINEFDDLDVPISEVAIKIGQTIRNLPTADVAEVVRCKNCAYRCTKNCNAKHERADMDFCSSGIR